MVDGLAGVGQRIDAPRTYRGYARHVQLQLRDSVVDIRAPVAVEGPMATYLLDEAHVEVPHEHLVFGVRGSTSCALIVLEVRLLRPAPVVEQSPG